MVDVYDEYGHLKDEKLKEVKYGIGAMLRTWMKSAGSRMDICEMKMYWIDITNEIDGIMGSEIRFREERMRMANSNIRGTNSKGEGNRQG